MIKSLVFTLLTIFCITLNAQIKIDVVGDNWEHNVHKALTLIKNTDTTVYNTVIKNFTNIGFWNGNYSTTEGNEIYITTI